MICPHCTISFHDQPERRALGKDKSGYWYYVKRHCPECDQLIIHLENSNVELPVYGSLPIGRIEPFEPEAPPPLKPEIKTFLVRPRTGCRPPCPNEVKDQDIREDYREACLVLTDSPKASAALSRRCLQNLLEKKAGVNPGDKLYKQINDAKQGLRTYLRDEIDDIRQLGNIAVHPIASKTTGVIAPVEPAEAEAMLNILEALFDVYYIQPARAKQRKKDIQSKKK